MEAKAIVDQGVEVGTREEHGNAELARNCVVLAYE